METRLLFRAVRLALGSGRPPPASGGARALHTGHRPPTTLLGRLVQRVLPQSARHNAPTHTAKPFVYRGVHTQHSNLSLPARQFIQQNTAKSLHSVPRPPMPSRNIQQVGLGKARNFSTASPLFHTGVKNVPIVARAFAQADFDLKGSVTDAKLKAARKGKKADKRTRALHRLAASNLSVSSGSNVPAEMEHYFPDVAPGVLTQVTISLEPVRSGASSPGDSSDSMTDSDFWKSLADLHGLYRPHMKRVEAVIRRLEPYAELRRNEDVIGWSSTYDDEFGLPTAVRFAFAAPVEDVQSWLGDFASSRWLTVEDVTPGKDRMFASLNTELDRVWNEGSVFPDPIGPLSHPEVLTESLTALPEWTTLPATPPDSHLPMLGASTPPEYLTDLGEAWMSGFGTPSEEWEYDAEEEDVLSEPDSLMSYASGPELQFSAQWERRSAMFSP